LEKTLSDEELQKLLQRIEDIMLGKIQYNDKLLMQLDLNSDNKNDYFKNDVATKGQTTGFKGPTLNYRKIGEANCGLECDDLFLSFMKKPIFKSICKRVYGNHASISIYRSMVFNKPAINNNDNPNENGNDKKGGGTPLPWHQDGGNWWALDRDPLIFVWTALYPSTLQSGCVKVIKKSHLLGILSQTGHMLSENDVKKYCSNEDNIDYLIAQPGETYLVHNWMIHCSETNKTSLPRWAFSANFIDGRTRVLNPKPYDAGSIGIPGQSFPLIFDSF